MIYNPPSYNNNLISQKAINSANNDDTLFSLIKDALATIAYQESNRVRDSKGISTSHLTEGYTLTENDLSILRLMIPLYVAETANYIQKLATKLLSDNDILIRLSNVVRKTLIYQGYLFFVVEAVEENVDGSTVTKEYLRINDNNTIRDITLLDILSSIEIMLSNSDFLNQLQQEIRV